MPGDRCEVVLYTPEHDATFASLGVAGARLGDRPVGRSDQGELGARDDVDYVLVFENRGAGGRSDDRPSARPDLRLRPRPAATPAAARGEVDARRRPRANGSCSTAHGWSAWVPYASTYPIALTIAPLDTRRQPASSSTAGGRDGLAAMLIEMLGRLDRLYGEPLPYMMWLNQSPTDGSEWPEAWFNIEIVSPWRSAGVPRFIAAAEVACDEFFNPVIPEVLAEQLRGPRLTGRPVRSES